MDLPTHLKTEAQRICTTLGGAWFGKYGLCRCPAHDDRYPSLSIRVGDRALLYKCHAGCSQADVVSAVRRLQRTFKVTAPIRQADVSTDNDNQWHLQLWSRAQPITGTPAETYLQRRGLIVPTTAPLRYLPRCRHRPSGHWLPALLAACHDLDGALVAVQRIYLDSHKPGLAPYDPARMLTNSPGPAAVQLAPATEKLGLAEGVETALAASQIHNCPVWAALTSARLHAIDIPDGVTTLLLFGDNDRAGRIAVDRAKAAYVAPGRSIRARFPPPPFNDWNDCLCR